MTGAVDRAWESFHARMLHQHHFPREIERALKGAFYAGANVVMTEVMHGADPRVEVDAVLNSLDAIGQDIERYLEEVRRA